jgi:sec-independent protein translocase protein TatA
MARRQRFRIGDFTHLYEWFSDFLEIPGGLMLEGLFQPMHLLLIVGLVLLVFGPKKLPELGKGLGDGIRGFKTAMNGGGDEKPADAAKAEPAENKAA